jgi:hypothetical protein
MGSSNDSTAHEDEDSDDNSETFFDARANNLPFLASALVGFYVIFDNDDAADVEQRGATVAQQRLCWAEHRDREVRCGLFRRMYRMELEHFELLVSLIRAGLTVNENMAQSRHLPGW